MATNRQSWGKSRPSSEPAAVAATYASTEVRWSEDRLSEGEGLVSGRGICGITISYARPGQGGGVLCWWKRTLVEAEAKM